MIRALAFLALVAGLSAPATGASPRTLEVPATAGWQHAATSMVLPARAAGLTRGPILDRTNAEQDVSAEYGGEDGLTTTIYIFQTPLADVPLWTDRAIAAIVLRPGFELDPGVMPAATPFARPGATVASGLRAALPLKAAGLTSTSVALVGWKDWIVKVRMTSSRLDPAALDARMTAFMQALRWPSEEKSARPAASISICSDTLVFKKAKLVRADMGDALMDGIIGTVESEQVEKGEAKPAVYCREPGPLGTYAVYRPGGSRTDM